MNEQRVHVILGATGGIGGALTRRLASGGARLVLAARSQEKLAALAEETGARPHAADATRFAEVEGVVQTALDAWGRIDGLVNCVGSVLLRPAHLTSQEDWENTMALNLGSAFASVRAACRPMSRSGGSIVLLSTAAVRVGIPNHEAIAAAKGGIEGLVRSAAATYGVSGVRVNAIAPGLVRTPLTERITANERAAESSRSMHVLGRLGEPDDVAAAIEWLLGPAASWVTGQVLGVDGGLGAVRTVPRV